MFDVILAPTDGSKHAARAMDAAIDLARKYEARLIVLHIELHHATAAEVDHILRGAEVPAAMRREIDGLHSVSAPIPVGGSRSHSGVSHILAEFIGNHITDRAIKAAQVAGVEKLGSRIVEGSPAKRIVEAARTEEAQLVVMGTRGLGGLQSMLQGSVSQSVRHACHCACLTIP